MDLHAFAAENRARCEAPNGFNHPLASWSLSDWMTAAMGELGEAANVVKKLNRVRDGVAGNKESEDELRAKLRAEIADTFIYLDLLAQAAGFDLASAVRETFDRKSAQLGYRGAQDPATPLTEEVAMAEALIRNWIPDVYPKNGVGQVHFARAVMESVAGVLAKSRAALKLANGTPDANLFWNDADRETISSNRDDITEDMETMEVFRLGRAVLLPQLHLVKFPIGGADGELDGYEIEEFATQEEAQAFILSLQTAAA
jgi:NTP pyrophosphatase (non-canonical NTP hydrolase)